MTTNTTANLQDLFSTVYTAQLERAASRTVYCGWGTVIDEIYSELEDLGASRQLLDRVFVAAINRANAAV